MNFDKILKGFIKDCQAHSWGSLIPTSTGQWKVVGIPGCPVSRLVDISRYRVILIFIYIKVIVIDNIINNSIIPLFLSLLSFRAQLPGYVYPVTFHWPGLMKSWNNYFNMLRPGFPRLKNCCNSIKIIKTWKSVKDCEMIQECYNPLV